MRNQNQDERSFQVTRRQLLTAGGATLVGAALSGSLFDLTALGQNMQDTKGIMSKDGGTKPTILPEANSTDPVAFSVAENIFWNDQLMEHAKFFIMLMPGPELAEARNQAEKFQQTFASQLEKSKTAQLDRSNYAAFNRSTIEMVKPFVDYKLKNRDPQASGQLKSLVWSTFFDHVAREAERFTQRLEQFSRGDTSTNMKEAAGFWTLIIGEHADFIAHLLDPAEVRVSGALA